MLTHSDVDKRVFPEPNEFIPERWIDKKELNPIPAAFAPFSLGQLLSTLLESTQDGILILPNRSILVCW